MGNVRTFIPARQVTGAWADLVPMVPAGMTGFCEDNCVRPEERLPRYRSPLARQVMHIGPLARVKAKDKGKGKQRASPERAPFFEERVSSGMSSLSCPISCLLTFARCR